ncbi:MAG: hypothetical protein K1X94_17615 [Sandaracinaceae bacterium]|nr:hypothetical protein [Sandaracinaceae bacterium]
MSDRSDWLRSLVKRAADGLGQRVREQPAVVAVRGLARDLRARSAGIPERVLSRLALRLPGVVSSSLRTVDGALAFEAELEGGRWARARLVPETPRFAARGAKELVFRVEPPEAAAESAVKELVGALSALVARTIWSAVMKPSETEVPEGAFVERDGAILHVDLRTVPSVRAALSTSAGATLLEAVRIERLEVRDGSLHVVLGLPQMP